MFLFFRALLVVVWLVVSVVYGSALPPCWHRKTGMYAQLGFFLISVTSISFLCVEAVPRPMGKSIYAMSPLVGWDAVHVIWYKASRTKCISKSKETLPMYLRRCTQGMTEYVNKEFEHRNWSWVTKGGLFIAKRFVALTKYVSNTLWSVNVKVYSIHQYSVTEITTQWFFLRQWIP